ncbi:MAG: hypothetical protein MJE77_08210 [Proteobacteria bacterium]|nr:hypothetical protein [Pseudomonadota bacterium]
MLFTPDGRLLISEGGTLMGNSTATGKGRVIQLDLGSGDVQVMADADMGDDLQPPNDVAFDDNCISLAAICY